jgi:hypothetical protein
MDGHSKNQNHQYLVPTFIHCVFVVEIIEKTRKNKKQRKEHEKMKKKKKKKNKGQPYPLTCEYHFFTNWTLKLDPMPLYKFIVPYKKMFF